MNKYERIATEVLEKVGGKENVTYATHCVSRLRLNLVNDSIPNIDEIKKIEGVLGCLYSGAQLQVIIGPGINQVYDAFCQMGGFEVKKQIQENIDSNVEKKKFTLKGLGAAILDGISGSLTPVIPVLVTAGLVILIGNIIGPTMLGIVDETNHFYRLMMMVGSAGLYSLPIFVAIGAAQKFGASPILAVSMACLLLYPDFISLCASGEAFTVYGIPMAATTYSSTVIPMILVAWVMSYVEKLITKFVPDMLKIIFLPLGTTLIMLPLTLCVLGPAGNFLGGLIQQALIWLHDVLGPIGIGIIGMLYYPLVGTGMHLPLVTTAVLSITSLGYDNVIMSGALPSVYALIAVDLVVLLRAKSKEDKGVALSCFVTQTFIGLGEPSIYGVLFKYKKALIACMLGSFVGGMYTGLMNCAIFMPPISNMTVALAYNGGGNMHSLIHGCIGSAIAFVIAFVILMVIGHEDKKKSAN